ncbi:MAG: hypothetical protein KKA07_04270 [Bacteroidetes bacterium]|nr:hypothetical protein [Bacteroidota bacterium]MBU1718267.1 hypothetical protein [Bacteroidota bacterium]
MAKTLKKYLIPLGGGVVGAVGGYLYYFFVGCASGSCPIQSNPWISTAWGGLMGYLLVDLALSFFRKKNKANNHTTTNDPENTTEG